MRRVLAVVGLVALSAIVTLSWAVRAETQDRDTHGRDAVPDYARVFAQDTVKRLDMRVTASDWDRLVADMTEMAGVRGADGVGGRGGFNVAPDPQALAACAGGVEGDFCTFGAPPQSGRCTILPNGAGLTCTPLPGVGVVPPDNNVPPGGRGGIPGMNPPGGNNNIGRDDVEFLPRTPIYIPASIQFDGVSFTNIGIRLKGNSSLVSSWSSGTEKLPFRINADGVEDQFPESRDQTFFGFPNLNLTNNSQDASFLRAKVVGDLFREAGVPAARTAFVRVFLDRGQGARYIGLYTLVEIPDKPMLAAQFGSDNGNLYKPNGTGARWTVFLAESFPKKTNQRDEDWTDVEDAIAVLNESQPSPRCVARAVRGALQRVDVLEVARSEHDRREHRHLWRILAAQLLGLRQPPTPGSALLHPVGSRSRTQCRRRRRRARWEPPAISISSTIASMRRGR